MSKPPFDFLTEHFLLEGGNVQAFERRRKRAVLNQDGVPVRLIDDLPQDERTKLFLSGARIEFVWVLVPITVRVKDRA